MPLTSTCSSFPADNADQNWRRNLLRRLLVFLAPVLAALSTARGNEIDYLSLTLPVLGDHTLHVLTPSLLELERINSKPTTTTPVDSWDFVDADGAFHAPALSEFAVTVDGTPVAVTAVGFKRRPLYAPVLVRDLRIENSLYLQLSVAIADGQTVEVKNPSGLLWATGETYVATTDPLRYSPAIHVNQEGYVPGLPKKAMIGYYLGDLGEMNVSASLGFEIVVAVTGTVVFQGALSARPDVGYLYLPTPYQNVLEADFSSFTTPGTYQLVVPSLGASLPFVIDEGIAMNFLRTYALGLYEQRCGTDNVMPFTRFVHGVCHIAPAEVPSPQSNFQFTWSTIASYNADFATNPRHTAPQLDSEAAQLYPFVNQGVIDVAGGHHDAGDYSKYTINSAALAHELMFTADAIPGAAALDNLGVPESGDGISDILQEAKQETDYIAKLQDADGGFYFIVYPKTREYESNVLPDQGDSQVVWPKNTAASAAAVAALAQAASSPLFKATYPATAALYLQKAKLGWQFLLNAIAAHGQDGSYQKITFYGDDYMHDDELAWAACELFVATGEAQYRDKLFEWFPDPSDPATFHWGWARMSESWGNAIRSYAFAARTGRLQLSQLDAAYLAKCEEQIVAAGDDALLWSNQNAYATSFPEETKHVLSAGWYFSLDQASDMAVAYQINPKSAYIDALVGNMNYEGGSNPVNVTYLTGLGQKRQREIVSQYAQNDRRVLPPDGIPIGNIQTAFAFLTPYGSELSDLVFPSDGAQVAPYEFYDRWADSYNVSTEYIAVNQARSLLALTVLATQTTTQSQPWKSGAAQITTPVLTVQLEEPTTLSVQAPGFNLADARIVWEARDQEPAFGLTYTISPKNNGPQWVEAEIAFPDGRRVFAVSTFDANSATVNWVDGAVPLGATTSATNGDAWNWVTPSPATPSGQLADQTNLATGEHSHLFQFATATVDVGVGDRMFAWIYLDPLNPPTEILLSWDDGSPEHRAFWGANTLTWGTNNSSGRYYAGPLPPTGEWVRLSVPASAVGLEGSTVTGMGFTLVDGRATWDVAGILAPVVAAPAIVTQPQPQTVATGTGMTFSVEATGFPAFTFQWRKNGVAIVGATDASYTLAQAVAADAGDYDVVITNSAGTITSIAVTLIVSKVTPMITWSTPAAIVYGTALSATQLNATANVPGTFAYNPAAGTVLAAGAGQVLSFSFTPTDSADYNNANGETTISVTLNFAWWEFGKFTSAELLDPTRSGPNVVFGIDGYSNLVKYALGLEPKQDVVAGLPEVSVQGANWVCTYMRPTDRADLIYSVETSTDLATWTTTGVTHELVSTAGGIDTWRGRCLLASATNAFFRLKIVRASDTSYSPPVGGMTIIAPAAQARSVSLPLLHGSVGAGTMLGRIGAVGANYLDVPAASWSPGGLSNAANPYYVRFRTGALAGRVMLTAATANTASRLFLSTDGTDLTQAGIVTGAQGDVFELVLADTLGSLFGGSTVQSGTTDATADTVQVWGGGSWIVFYYNATRLRWEASTDVAASPSRNTFVLRPDRGFMLTRRAAVELRIYLTGRVPETAPRYFHARAGTTFLSAGVPADVTLGLLALQTQSGWQAGATAVAATTTADLVQTWGGGSWLYFYYDSTLGYWRNTTDVPASPNRNTFVIPAGRPMMIRRLTTGGNILNLARPYSIAP